MKIIGIIAALAQEADAIFPGQGLIETGFRRVALGDRTFIIATSGIGKVNAALGASNLVLRHKAQLLFVIGTAGALGPRHGTFVITEAVQTDYGARRSDGFAHFRAGEWPIGAASCPPYEATALTTTLPRARIATSDAFVECPDHAAYLLDVLGCDLIDMETGAVAQAAAALDVSWAAVKATTDAVDGDSASDFTANLMRAAKDAAAAAEQILDRV